MKEKMKRGDLVTLNVLLGESVRKSDKYDKRFKFAIHRNLEYFKDEIKAMAETQKESPRFEEYQQKRNQVGMEYADKDENGNPVMQLVEGTNVYVVSERKEEANGKIAELIKEYHDAIEEHKEAMNQFNELMEEEIEIDVCKISFEYLPEDADYNAFKWIIKETPEEIEEKYL